MRQGLLLLVWLVSGINMVLAMSKNGRGKQEKQFCTNSQSVTTMKAAAAAAAIKVLLNYDQGDYNQLLGSNLFQLTARQNCILAHSSLFLSLNSLRLLLDD